VSVPRKIEHPDRDFPAGYEALKPYRSQDDLWSPSDALKRLFDSPAIRQRVGEIIARARGNSEQKE
jgi:hypothetical protein